MKNTPHQHEAKGISHLADIMLAIKKIYQDHPLPALTLCYSAIDICASLIKEDPDKDITGKEFVDWIDKYCKFDPKTEFTGKSMDIWGARCGLVHSGSPISRKSREGKADLIAYAINEASFLKATEKSRQGHAIADYHKFASKIIDGITEFTKDVENNDELRRRFNTNSAQVFNFAQWPMDSFKK
jgi:hypothetical protein